MKRALRIISLLVTGSLLLSACTVNLKKRTEVTDSDYEEKYDVIDKGPVKGGTVRLFSTPVDTLNPVVTNNTYVQDFLGLVFEGLFKLDTDQQPVPVLAKSSSISGDGLTMTVYLRDNVKWQDNMPFTADDVVFTINTIMNTKNKSVYIKNVQYIAGATAGSGNTVVLKLKQPYAFIRNELTFPIIPMHHFVNENVSNLKSKANFSPIGTGPYSFHSYSADAGVKLKANDTWWNAKGAAIANSVDAAGETVKKSDTTMPYIQTVEVKIFKSSNAANTAFQSRDIDVLPAEYGDFRKYIGRTDITMKRYSGRSYEFLSLNLKSGPFSDKNFRNAVNMLIDKKQLVDSAASGIAVPAEIPVQPASWIYKLINLEQTYNTEKAKNLLSQSGYSLSAGKYGRKGSGRKLTLKLIVNDDNNLRINVANTIAAQLGKNGISVEVVKMPWDNVQNTIKSGAYDMAMAGYRISSIPDLSFAYATSQIQAGLNIAGYSNAAADGLLQNILTQNNSDTQKSQYTNLLKLITDERPYIGLFFLNESVMYSRNIRGAVNPNVWNKYNDISQWYLP